MVALDRRDRQSPRSSSAEELAGSPEPGSELVLADPQLTMSGAEWAARYRAMVAASAFHHEQARILKSAKIVDDSHELGVGDASELIPQAFANHLRGVLAANPSLLTDETVADLQRILQKRVGQKLGESAR